MMADARGFLTYWVHENVNVGTFDDEGVIGQRLAQECLADAEREGWSEEDLEEAADGSLASFMSRANDARMHEHFRELARRD